MKNISVMPIVLAFAISGAPCHAQQEDSVASKLFSGEKRLQAWADELEKTQPETLAEVWDALEVFLRAERDEAALRLFPRIIGLALNEEPLRMEREAMREMTEEERELIYQKAEVERGRARQRARILESLCKLPPERAKLGIAFFETCGTAHAPSYSFEELAESMRATGWDDEKITDWLKNRCQAAMAMETKQEEMWRHSGDLFYLQILLAMPRTAKNWQDWYFKYLAKSPRRDGILLQIMDDARQSPDDMKKLAVFLSSFAKYWHGMKPVDADWLLETIERRSPLEAWIVGKCLAVNHRTNFMRAHEIQEAFFKRALAEPLSAEERGKVKKLHEHRSNIFCEPPSDDEIQAMFSVEAMDGLNKLYLGLNRGDDAQRVMLEARELRKKHRLGNDNFLAGETQAASGFRVVENEIREREALDAEKPEYWRERARYYKGRNEPEEEEKALRKLLAFYDVPEYKADIKSHTYMSALNDLFQFLWMQKRQDEAMKLFKEHRDAAKGNTRVLSSLYFYGMRRVDFGVRKFGAVGNDEKYFPQMQPWLREDLRDAYREFKTNPEEFRYTGGSFLFDCFDEAVRANILDFENDPMAWVVLAVASNGMDLKKIRSLLFPGDEKKPNGKILQKMKEAVERGVFKGNQIYDFGEVLHGAADYKNADWFLLAALERAESDFEKGKCHDGLMRNCLAAGDWRNCEKYIFLLAEKEAHWRAIQWGAMNLDTLCNALRQCADLAEKSGAVEDAQRMRARIANMGVFP